MIFLYLNKAYIALDRSRCLDILDSYDVGPLSCRLLRTYWRRLTMVERAGGYYGADFKGDRGVTQGDPLPPTLFNVVVDAVVRNCLTMMVEGAEERVECGQEGRHHNSLFYANNGMVSSLDPRWLQGAFSTLVGLFDRVGLHTNFGKKVDMVCFPCQVERTQLEEAYGRQMTGDGSSYRELQRGRVQCRECGGDMEAGLMAGHMTTQHGRSEEDIWSWTTSAMGEEPRTYRMEFLAKGGPRSCPFEGCLGRATTRTAMQVHFLHRHVQETVVILEEGNLPHPRCPCCNKLLPWRTLNRRHLSTTQCTRGAKRKRRRLVEEELRESTERAFQAYGKPLENMTAFRYLGRVMMAGDDDWTAVVGNLQKVRKS